jgi:hypothetical protein
MFEDNSVPVSRIVGNNEILPEKHICGRCHIDLMFLKCDNFKLDPDGLVRFEDDKKLYYLLDHEYKTPYILYFSDECDFLITSCTDEKELIILNVGNRIIYVDRYEMIEVRDLIKTLFKNYISKEEVLKFKTMGSGRQFEYRCKLPIPLWSARWLVDDKPLESKCIDMLKMQGIMSELKKLIKYEDRFIYELIVDSI